MARAPRWRVAIPDDHEPSRASLRDLGRRRRGRRRGVAVCRRGRADQARDPRRGDLRRGPARRRRHRGGRARQRDDRLSGCALHEPHRRRLRRARAEGGRDGLSAEAPAPGRARTCARRRHRAVQGGPPAEADARRAEGHRAREGLAHGALRAHRRRSVPPAASCGDGQPQADGGDRQGVARVGVSHARCACGIGRPFRTRRANPPKFLTPASVQALLPSAGRVDNDVPRERGRGAAQTDPHSPARRHEKGAPANTKGDIMSVWSRREFLRGSLVAGTGLAAGIGFPKILTAQGREPIKVGILHSLSGTMAISEAPNKEVVLMAIGEINKAGGVLGRKVEPVVEDPASNWDLFAEKSKKLLLQDKVATVFGCWTSVSRKSVLPVFEKNNGLLFYPVQYEGEECSKNVIYTGATINQQATPGVDYLMSPEGGGKKKFYLLGSDYVYPRTTNKILRLYLTKV